MSFRLKEKTLYIFLSVFSVLFTPLGADFPYGMIRRACFVDEGPLAVCASSGDNLAVGELRAAGLRRDGQSRPGPTWRTLGQAQRCGPMTSCAH